MKKYFLALYLLCFECTPDRSAQDIEKSLDGYFAAIFGQDEPGACISIMKDDQVVYSRAYGLADLETKEPITTKTLFNLGSITKPFVAYAILMLRDQGKLSLNDPLSKYFAEFKNKAIAEKVTLFHLLTHTSGLPDIRKVTEDSVFYLTAKDDENWAPILQADSLNFEPGEAYEYSNPAFNALALIIEQVSGMKWQEFVEDNIFRPSGMMTSTITDGSHPEAGVAHAYERTASGWIEDDYGEEPTFAAAGNGGVWSSAEELGKFERAIRQAVFLEESTIEESQEIAIPAHWKGEESPFIGFSWFIGQTKEGYQIVEHTGTQGGFYGHYISVPTKKVLYVILANRYFDRDEAREKVISLLQDRHWLD